MPFFAHASPQISRLTGRGVWLWACGWAIIRGMDTPVTFPAKQGEQVTRTPPVDIYGRGLRDLRISVTDRCNLRCRYCMPKEIFGDAYRFLPSTELMSFDEIVLATECLQTLGVEKIRITGGEPLIRKDIEGLISRISKLGIKDIALTTNAMLLSREKARSLKEAGLDRVTVSLDALEKDTFQRMTGSSRDPEQVLDAIELARDAGFGPVKINMVVQRGVNEHMILPMARHFRGSGHILRFIEYMDVGTSNGWSPRDVVPAAEIRQLISGEWPLEPLPRHYPGEVARRYRYRDDAGELGFIASVTEPFCGGCTRLRLTAEGQLYTCLFGGRGHDLRGLLRRGASRNEIAGVLAAIWSGRSDRYSEVRKKFGQVETDRREMWQIGG